MIVNGNQKIPTSNTSNQRELIEFDELSMGAVNPSIQLNDHHKYSPNKSIKCESEEEEENMMHKKKLKEERDVRKESGQNVRQSIRILTNPFDEPLQVLNTDNSLSNNNQISSYALNTLNTVPTRTTSEKNFSDLEDQGGNPRRMTTDTNDEIDYKSKYFGIRTEENRRSIFGKGNSSTNVPKIDLDKSNISNISHPDGNNSQIISYSVEKKLTSIEDVFNVQNLVKLSIDSISDLLLTKPKSASPASSKSLGNNLSNTNTNTNNTNTISTTHSNYSNHAHYSSKRNKREDNFSISNYFDIIEEEEEQMYKSKVLSKNTKFVHEKQSGKAYNSNTTKKKLNLSSLQKTRNQPAMSNSQKEANNQSFLSSISTTVDAVNQQLGKIASSTNPNTPKKDAKTFLEKKQQLLNKLTQGGVNVGAKVETHGQSANAKDLKECKTKYREKETTNITINHSEVEGSSSGLAKVNTSLRSKKYSMDVKMNDPGINMNINLSNFIMNSNLKSKDSETFAIPAETSGLDQSQSKPHGSCGLLPDTSDVKRVRLNLNNPYVANPTKTNAKKAQGTMLNAPNGTNVTKKTMINTSKYNSNADLAKSINISAKIHQKFKTECSTISTNPELDTSSKLDKLDVSRSANLSATNCVNINKIHKNNMGKINSILQRKVFKSEKQGMVDVCFGTTSASGLESAASVAVTKKNTGNTTHTPTKEKKHSSLKKESKNLKEMKELNQKNFLEMFYIINKRIELDLRTNNGSSVIRRSSENLNQLSTFNEQMEVAKNVRQALVSINRAKQRKRFALDFSKISSPYQTHFHEKRNSGSDVIVKQAYDLGAVTKIQKTWREHFLSKLFVEDVRGFSDKNLSLMYSDFKIVKVSNDEKFAKIVTALAELGTLINNYFDDYDKVKIFDSYETEGGKYDNGRIKDCGKKTKSEIITEVLKFRNTCKTCNSNSSKTLHNRTTSKKASTSSVGVSCNCNSDFSLNKSTKKSNVLSKTGKMNFDRAALKVPKI